MEDLKFDIQQLNQQRTHLEVQKGKIQGRGV
jgi:hypothetical protein